MISSSKATRGSSCEGKKPFDTYATAEREIGALIHVGAHRPEQGVLNPYFCHQCLKFHLGHLGKERK